MEESGLLQKNTPHCIHKTDRGTALKKLRGWKHREIFLFRCSLCGGIQQKKLNVVMTDNGPIVEMKTTWVKNDWDAG